MKTGQVLALMIVYVLFGCGNSKRMDGESYYQYMEDSKNNLKKAKKIDEISYEVQYCPYEYLLMNEFRSHKLTKEIVSARKDTAENLVYFKVRLRSTSGLTDVLNYKLSDSREYMQRLDYLSYGFEEDMALYNGHDTVPPALFHFERTYGVAPFADFMIAFPNRNLKKENSTLLIYDRVFGGGLVKFDFDKSDINNIPELITD